VRNRELAIISWIVVTIALPRKQKLIGKLTIDIVRIVKQKDSDPPNVVIKVGHVILRFSLGNHFNTVRDPTQLNDILADCVGQPARRKFVDSDTSYIADGT
jgi:hypothetical protein